MGTHPIFSLSVASFILICSVRFQLNESVKCSVLIPDCRQASSRDESVKCSVQFQLDEYFYC